MICNQKGDGNYYLPMNRVKNSRTLLKITFLYIAWVIMTSDECSKLSNESYLLSRKDQTNQVMNLKSSEIPSSCSWYSLQLYIGRSFRLVESQIPLIKSKFSIEHTVSW